MAKTRAETSFCCRVKEGLTARNYAAVELAFTQYGAYLELIGEDEPLGEARSFVFPAVELELPKLMAIMAEPSPFVEA